jgi:uncharacterized integral membrane protein
MMKWKINLILGLVALMVIFSLQNADVVTIRFLFWSFMTSRVFVVFGAFSMGMFFAWILTRLPKS